jgi:lipid II:glycine glycyltransferase (peptidoglycan interpeptide bridge formation enzyme)
VTTTVRRAVDADRAAWDAFVAAEPSADLLQSWAWGEAWRLEGETPLRLVAHDGAESIRAVAQLLVRPTSARRTMAYVPHGPVWDRTRPDGDEAVDGLIAEIAEVARHERAIVVKLDPRTAPDGSPADLEALARRHGLLRARHDLQATSTRIVELLDGGPELAASWHKDERNRVRRAEREGVTTRVSGAADGDAIATFADLLDDTARREGFRGRSAGFIERLALGLQDPAAWWLTIASLAGRPIAGVATPSIGDRAWYLYGASARDPELQHAFGSDAAMAAAMAALAANGVRTLDMWGVAEPDDPTTDPAWAGFSLFKRRFGGTALRHAGTYDLVIDRPLYLVRDARERVIDAIGGRR